MRKVETLLQLQRVDSELDRARERLVSVDQQLADRSAVAALETELRAAEADLQRKVREQRDLELEVQDLRDKLTALEKKLYGGTVHNPKELSDMAKEAQQFRGLISSREDRLIGMYDLVEASASEVGGITARLEAARAAHDARQRELIAEREGLLTTIAEDERRQATLRAESDAQALRVYDGLRRTRGGLAVAEVAQRTCQGCRISLPVKEEIRARTSPDLVFCQSCGRILHAGL